MTARRFVRRSNRIPDQQSLISTQEQARLLNDPAVPIDVHRTTGSEGADSEAAVSERSTHSIHQTAGALVENEKAA